jgi:hypothetical protein
MRFHKILVFSDGWERIANLAGRQVIHCVKALNHHVSRANAGAIRIGGDRPSWKAG